MTTLNKKLCFALLTASLALSACGGGGGGDDGNSNATKDNEKPATPAPTPTPTPTPVAGRRRKYRPDQHRAVGGKLCQPAVRDRHHLHPWCAGRQSMRDDRPYVDRHWINRRACPGKRVAPSARGPLAGADRCNRRPNERRAYSQMRTLCVRPDMGVYQACRRDDRRQSGR